MLKVIHVAGPGQYPEVETYAELPSASDMKGKLFIVRTATGTIFINRKRAGIYFSDGNEWKKLGQIVLAGAESPTAGYLISNPPPGNSVAVNIYYDPNLDRVVVEKESEPVP
ncbi:hypothetical protein ES703_78976 [subsurface metagenome]